MMKIVIASLICFTTALSGVEVSVGLVPESEMGSRDPQHVRFTEIAWSTDSPWFHKPAPVCRVVDRPLDVEPFRRFALEYGMQAVPPEKWTDSDAGSPKEAGIYFTGGPKDYLWSIANPRSRTFKVGIARFDGFDRDQHKLAVVKPLPLREETVRIAREWLAKLGIDEAEFHRGGTWPEGFDVSSRIHSESGTHPVTKETVRSDFGITPRFIQQIGGLPAFWSGFGGNVMFEIADGGEFCSLIGCLRAWEKIGDFPVLNQEEITAALQEGYRWVHQPVACERLEIVKVVLKAYHAPIEKAQKDFPLIYTLHCKLHGGAMDGKEGTILMPALKQHRGKYPRPGDRGEKDPRWWREAQ